MGKQRTAHARISSRADSRLENLSRARENLGQGTMCLPRFERRLERHQGGDAVGVRGEGLRECTSRRWRKGLQRGRVT